MRGVAVVARALVTAALGLALGTATPDAAHALNIGGPGVSPADFRITAFATGLNFPYGMQLLSDGSLLVATSRPVDPNNPSFFNSVGELIRLLDTNGDGVADSSSIALSGLPGVLTGLGVAGNLVFVTSSAFGQERISVLRMGATPADPFSFIGALTFTFPPNWEHTTYGLAVRPTPAQAGSWDLFFNVGSDGNNTQSAATVPLAGLTSGTLEGASIYKVTVTDTGNAVSVAGLTRIASGLRNAAGMAFHPVSRDFYFADNGIDGLTDPDEPLSVDEMNVIAAGAIGGTVEDFGFPENYTQYRTGSVVGGAGIQPIATFQPILSPNGAESEGPVQIAVAPRYFPAAVNNGIFVGFHGKFDGAEADNEENALVYLDLGTGQYFHFISSTEPGIGHPDGLVATDDSLFIADLSSTGFLEGVGTGVIYQIRALSTLTPVLTVSPTSVAAGDTVTATWSGIAAPTPTDWIGLYAVGTADGAYLAWVYVSCSHTPAVAQASGSCALPIPGSVTPGTYELRLFAADGFAHLATGNSFRVTP